MPLFDDKTVTSISELIAAMHDVVRAGDIRWFRGHANVAWKLLPSLARPPNAPDKELALIKRFKQNAYSILPIVPAHNWHWLFLMQHHGAPTRLLDWTENPLVGLYFAVDEKHPDVDGVVWVLNPVGLNTDGSIQSEVNGELPFFGIDDELKPYETEALGRPVVKQPVAALAPRYFPRLAAQSGVFTVMHRAPVPVEEAHGGVHAGRIVIPKAAKADLRQDLAALGITRLALFPELDAVAKHAMEVLR